MKAGMWAALAAGSAILGASVVAAQGTSVADLMAQGKLEADLGNHARAAEAFEGVAEDVEAPAALRWEALVRRGLALQAAGDYDRSVEVFERVWNTYGKNPEALRFLILSVSGAVPGGARWEEVWPKVVLEVDRTAPRPTVTVHWPGAAAPGSRRYKGDTINLDFKDGNLQDIFRLFADITGLNVVVYPGVKGQVTFAGKSVPWDEALDRMLAPSGLGYALDGKVLRIARFEHLGESRNFVGSPTDVELQEEPIDKALRSLAEKGGLRVSLEPGVDGTITLKLDGVPWDQALDLIVRLNGLEWKREGGAIRVFKPARTKP